jgi:hypothetical protein
MPESWFCSCNATTGQISPGMKFIGCDCCGHCIRTRVVSNRVVRRQPVPFHLRLKPCFVSRCAPPHLLVFVDLVAGRMA